MKDKLYQLMNWARIEGIVYSEEDHPEEVLGPHLVGNSILYQAFFPFVQKATLVLEEKGKRVVMEEADEAGFFAAVTAGKTLGPYHYELMDLKGNLREQEDPYAFPVTLQKEELKRFYHGIHYELYKMLGSHLTTLNGVKGMRFAVWVPDAVRVSIVGEFNHWDGRVYPMCRVGESDVFTLFIPGLTETAAYQYEVKYSGDRISLQEDFFAASLQVEDRSCSQSYREEELSWKDEDYIAQRGSQNDRIFLYQASREELLEPKILIERAASEGYTHVVLPETVGSRYFYQFSISFGEKYGIRKLVNQLHQKGIGVLLQWNIAGIHSMERKEFSNFYLANVLYILEQYHLDGVVFSQMASLLYLDYGKADGQWRPNIYGGNENLDAVEWVKHMNSILRKRVKGCLILADMDAIWPGVTDRLDEEGLGFDYRYDTDFTKEFLFYLESDPYFRSGIHHNITERMLYAYRERFIMAFGQEQYGNLWERIPGQEEEKFKTLKLALAYPMFLPGKMLSSYRAPGKYEKYFSRMVKECCLWNQTLSPLEAEDGNSENFSWINCFQHNDCVVSFHRCSREDKGVVLVIANFANAVREEFNVGVPYEGKYRLFFHTESKAYGGKLDLNQAPIYTREQEWDGLMQSVTVTLEPLSLQAYVFVPYTEEELYEIARRKAEEIRLKLEQEAMDKAKELKKSSLKDTLAIQVEKCEEAILQGSESKRKMESRQKRNGAGSRRKTADK